MCVCVCVCVGGWVGGCVGACVRACVCVCVNLLKKENSCQIYVFQIMLNKVLKKFGKMMSSK